MMSKIQLGTSGESPHEHSANTDIVGELWKTRKSACLRSFKGPRTLTRWALGKVEVAGQSSIRTTKRWPSRSGKRRELMRSWG